MNRYEKKKQCQEVVEQTRRNITPQQSQGEFNLKKKKAGKQRHDSYQNLSFSPLLCFQKISRTGS